MTVLEDVISEVENMVISGSDLSNALWMVLSNYELVRKTTELAPSNDNIYYLNKFIATKRIEGLSEYTLEQYERENKRFFLFCGKNINDVTKDDIRAYLAVLQSKRKIKMSTAMNCKRYLSSFYNWLNDEAIIQHSPTRNLNMKCPKTIRVPFTNRELDTLRNSGMSVRNKAIIELLISTGIRVGELVNIQISNINFYDKSVQVTGKGNKQRIVFFDDIAAMYLEKYLKTIDISSNILFPSKANKNRGIKIEAVQTMIRTLGRKYNIKAYPHKFRRTFATNALKNGMPIATLSKIMGHEDIKTTMLYCNIDDIQLKMGYIQASR